MSKYPVDVFYSERLQGYVARIPGLASCSAYGETPSEALEHVLRIKQNRLRAQGSSDSGLSGIQGTSGRSGVV